MVTVRMLFIFRQRSRNAMYVPEYLHQGAPTLARKVKETVLRRKVKEIVLRSLVGLQGHKLLLILSIILLFLQLPNQCPILEPPHRLFLRSNTGYPPFLLPSTVNKGKQRSVLLEEYTSHLGDFSQGTLAL